MAEKKLLTPFKLGGNVLRNRIVMAPLTRARAGDQRLANALMAEYYAQRASAGLIISEATVISEQANGWVQSPGIYTDAMAEAWKLITHHGTLMGNCGYTVDSAEAAVSSGAADLIAFGRPFISNPDLVARIANDWPMASTAEVAD